MHCTKLHSVISHWTGHGWGAQPASNHWHPSSDPTVKSLLGMCITASQPLHSCCVIRDGLVLSECRGFLLGPHIEEARAAGNSTEDKSLFEFNLRTQVLHSTGYIRLMHHKLPCLTPGIMHVQNLRPAEHSGRNELGYGAHHVSRTPSHR